VRDLEVDQEGSTRELGVGIVGLGYWGPNLLRVASESDRASVRRICDRDGDRLDRLARRYPAPTATRDFGDLVDDPEVDAIVIATPVFSHYELATRSLAAGKHTFVEKPLAASSDEATSLIDLAQENDVALMCGHTFLYSPPVRRVKQLLDDDEIGDVYFISSSRVNLGLHQRDVSVLWDLAPHDFSILLYWLDEFPTSVRATGRDSIVPGIPDVAFVTLQFGSGIVVNIELSWLAPSKLRRTAIVGSNKMVVYDDTSTEQIRIFDRGVVYEDPETFGQYHLSYRTGDVLSPRLDTVEPLAVQFGDFVDACRRGAAPAKHVELARDVVRLIEASEASLAEGGTPVELAAVP
jgi:predicted dehydrogenase